MLCGKLNQNLEQNYTQCVNINLIRVLDLLVVGFAFWLIDFRGYVERSSHFMRVGSRARHPIQPLITALGNNSMLLVLSRFTHGRQPEIPNDQLVLVSKKNISRFYIAVNDFFLVQIVQPFQDLLE